MKIVKAKVTLHGAGGVVTKVGQTTTLSAHEAEVLEKRGFVSIVGDAPVEPVAPVAPAAPPADKPKGKGKAADEAAKAAAEKAAADQAAADAKAAADAAPPADPTGDGVKAEGGDNGGGV